MLSINTPLPAWGCALEPTKLISELLHMTLGKLLNLFVPQFLICKNRNNINNDNTCIIGF